MNTLTHTGKDDIISSKTLQQHVQEALQQYFENLDGRDPIDLYELFLEEVESALLEAVMTHTRENQSRAATCLGLARGTLRKKLRQYFGDRYVSERLNSE